MEARCSSPPDSVDGYSSVKGAKAEPVQQSASLLPGLSRPGPRHHKRDSDVGGNREVVQEGRKLEHEAARGSTDQGDVRLLEAPDVGVVSPRDRAPVGLPEPGQRVEQCRLPGPAGSHDGEDLTSTQLQIDATQHTPGAEALGQPASLQRQRFCSHANQPPILAEGFPNGLDLDRYVLQEACWVSRCNPLASLLCAPEAGNVRKEEYALSGTERSMW